MIADIGRVEVQGKVYLVADKIIEIEQNIPPMKLESQKGYDVL